MSDPPRVGLFGLLGSGNIGNDASLESMLGFLRADHPDAILDAMCSGPDRVRSVYGIDAVPLSWYQQHERASAVATIGFKLLGKCLDVVRISSWVRRHDAVIVPGMGVLETTLPLRAFGGPLEMFLVAASGRLFGTRVAFVSIGANVVNQRVTRWLYRSAARLAFYCSYRDAGSREAMWSRHLGRGEGPVYPDLAFGIPAVSDDPGDPQIVGVGVMDLHGTNDERQRATAIYESYIEGVKRFIVRLIDDGRQIRLFVGDTKGCDDGVVQEILADVQRRRPGLDPRRVTAARTLSFDELMRAMAPVGLVVATRYHNVICALLLCKPTISLGYAAKHRELMADMGLEEFCQGAGAVDADLLIDQCTQLQDQSGHVRQILAKRNDALAKSVADQFSVLSGLLFPPTADDGARALHTADVHGTSQQTP